jgi:hypothetical protein
VSVYNVLRIAVILGFCAVIEAVHLYSTWFELRRLLLALERSRLRRALLRLRPVTTGGAWGAAGTVHRAQYRLLYQQFEALRRLDELFKTSDPPIGGVLKGTYGEVVDAVAVATRFGQQIVAKTRHNLTGSNDLWGKALEEEEEAAFGNAATSRNIREIFADTAAYCLNHLWKHDWKADRISIYTKDNLLNEVAQQFEYLTPSEQRAPEIEAARACMEEFLAAFYTSFVHNIMAGCVR